MSPKTNADQILLCTLFIFFAKFSALKLNIYFLILILIFCDGFQTLFTTMFWITMRQYMREREESRSTSTVAHIMAPVHVTVGTATGRVPSFFGGGFVFCFFNDIQK